MNDLVLNINAAISLKFHQIKSIILVGLSGQMCDSFHRLVEEEAEEDFPDHLDPLKNQGITGDLKGPCKKAADHKGDYTV